MPTKSNSLGNFIKKSKFYTSSKEIYKNGEPIFRILDMASIMFMSQYVIPP